MGFAFCHLLRLLVFLSGPSLQFSSNYYVQFDLYSIPQALKEVIQYHEQVQNLKNQESTLRRGLNIFKIEQAPSKDLHALEKDLDHLEQVWTITKEWEDLWDSWKVGRFTELVTTDMETTSQLLFKRLNKTIREIKVGHFKRSFTRYFFLF